MTSNDRRAESTPGRRSYDLAAFHDANCRDASCVAHREAIAALEVIYDDDSNAGMVAAKALRKGVWATNDDDGPNMTDAQRTALRALCDRYSLDYVESHYSPAFDLPAGYLAGWIGGSPGTLYVGVDADGNVSS